jgi:NAD(P)H dehydrogenase (quinone)
MKEPGKISIVYHSNYGHTKITAEHIRIGASRYASNVNLLSVIEARENIELVHQSDAIIFGCPTYFGSVSAEFKSFMEFTGSFWYKQTWKNKVAAGFTNSSTNNGDKLNTLIQLAIFAAQHSMLWAPLGVLPTFVNDIQTDEQNRLASYLGLMTLSNNSLCSVEPPSDLKTAEMFGENIAMTVQRLTILDRP